MCSVDSYCFNNLQFSSYDNDNDILTSYTSLISQSICHPDLLMENLIKEGNAMSAAISKHSNQTFDKYPIIWSTDHNVTNASIKQYNDIWKHSVDADAEIKSSFLPQPNKTAEKK